MSLFMNVKPAQCPGRALKKYPPAGKKPERTDDFVISAKLTGSKSSSGLEAPPKNYELFMVSGTPDRDMNYWSQQVGLREIAALTCVWVEFVLPAMLLGRNPKPFQLFDSKTTLDLPTG